MKELKRLSAGFLAAILWLAALPVVQIGLPVTVAGAATVSLSGCTNAEIQNDINVIINSAQAVIKVAEPNATWLAPLNNSISALESAETSWLAGSPVQIIDSALNTVSAVLAVIPFTAVYSPLIAILVTGIEACLALIPPPASASPTPIAAAALRGNPYHGRVSLKKPHLFQSRAGAYKDQWDATADMLGLTAAKI